MKRDLYAEMSARIVAELEAGAAPWIKPWSASPGANTPCNAVSNRPYSGCNVVLLWMAQAAGYRTRRFLTFKQALELGGNVRKGERGTKVYFVKQLQVRDKRADDNATTRLVPMMREYTVFNVDQCENLPDNINSGKPVRVRNPNARDEFADAFLHSTGADIRECNGEAYYVPSRDFISMPAFVGFKGADHFYNVVFHELTHYAVSWIMPHGRVWRWLRLLLAMRQFGIIRVLRGRRAVRRWDDTAQDAFLDWLSARVPFPSAACRRGCRSGLFRRIRARAIVRSRIDRRRDGAAPSRYYGAACVA